MIRLIRLRRHAVASPGAPAAAGAAARCLGIRLVSRRRDPWQELVIDASNAPYAGKSLSHAIELPPSVK